MLLSVAVTESVFISHRFPGYSVVHVTRGNNDLNFT